MLQLVLAEVRKTGLLTDDLNIRESWHKHDRDKNRTYFGFCKLPSSPHHRRIDIKVYPKESYATGLVYFTGSAHFNRSMRLWAKRKSPSIKLEDYGLQEVLRDAKGHTIHKGRKLECKTERDVFRHLGLKWMDPTQRNGGATVAALTTT